MSVGASTSVPWTGAVVTVKVSEAVSTSEPVSVIASAVPSGVVTDCAFATGMSFTGSTLIVTVAVATEFCTPSFAR